MFRFTTFQVTVIGLLLFWLGFGAYRLAQQGAVQEQLEQELLTRGYQPAPEGPEPGPIEKLEGPALLELREQMKINVNEAGVDELRRLPGVGPSTAQRIIDHRTEHGDFQSIEDLVQVPRIGPKSLQRFRDQITVGHPEPPPEGGDGEGEAASAGGSGGASGLVDLNTAGSRELETLPRIGPATARNILDYREKHGPFQSFVELLKVKRIGPKTLERLRDRVTVSGRRPELGAAGGDSTGGSSGRHSSGPLAPDETIDINTASAAELERLPGVGPSTAKKILEHRAVHGPFTRIEDIVNVHGIGPAKFEKMKPHLRVQ